MEERIANPDATLYSIINNMQKALFGFILPLLLSLLMLFVIATFIKDQILSYQLSNIAGRKIDVQGLSFLELVRNKLSGFTLAEIVVGEDEDKKITLKNIKVDDIKKHIFRIDIARIFRGEEAEANCSAKLWFERFTNSLDSEEVKEIKIKKFNLKMGESKFSSHGNAVYSPESKTITLNLNEGNLSKSRLNKELVCLAPSLRDLKAGLELSNLNLTITKASIDDSDISVNGNGDFKIYQKRQKTYRLINDVLNSYLYSYLETDDKSVKDVITGNFSLLDGYLYLKNINLNSEICSVKGLGAVNLLKNTLDIDLVLYGLENFIDSKKIAKHDSIPVKISGTVKEPKIQTNFASQ